MTARETGIPDVDAVLDSFHPAVAAWVREQFDAPTEVQLRGWEAISRGGHVLLGAPTGSGKTLAAFLSGIDQLFREPEPEPAERLRLLYLSPLRALNYDIERNLRAPLQGIRRHAERLGLQVPELRVGVRTGDTPQSERQRQKRNPPDIFITTPESLYVMLTSGTRELFDHVRWTIVDEIHALASNKRGTHLAFTLERLAMRVHDAAIERGEDPPAGGFQRIGLSATQRPIDRISAFLGGCAEDRDVQVIETPGDKQHDLQVVVPVDDMTAVGSKIVAADLADLDTPTSNSPDTDAYSIWSALHAELLDHVEAHTSTIVFVNSRRLAERLATALNDLAQRRTVARYVASQRAEHEAQGLEWTDDTEVDVPADLPTAIVARAHHGSISRETRTEMEELLKAGQLPCIVATSSLELGIDMGAVDLVLLVESPRSVASGLQRIGRAGHNVGDISRGRIYPKHRADLVEAAAVTRLMSRREIEPVHVPELCLDVLAQQLVATCVERAFTVDELLELTRRAWPWRDISDDQFHNLLSLLAGYFPVDEAADIKARVVWDRQSGEVKTRSDAAKVAITNAGTIPDRGLYGVFAVGGGGRVGELDEEMVHETRLGDVIVLGSTSWRVEEITRDRVNVSPQPGAIGKPPFWHGEGAGRTVELGRAVGELVRTVADASPDAANVDDPQLAAHVDDVEDAELLEALERYYLCDRRAARNLVAFVREQVAATGAAPDDRTIIVERFRDELGDWRICILTPFGKPVHAPWAMAIEERLLAEHGLEATALWSDDGIALRLPDIDSLPPIETLLPDPDELEDLLVNKLGGSALFASRFREVATRALVLPLSSFRRRSPLWLQRMRAADVLRVAQEQASFPMILETYREVMRDVFSLPDLRRLLQGVHERTIRLVEVETRTASVMSASLLFDYTGTFMYDYDGDKPSAERRVQALSLDQALLRELLGTGDLRELLELAAIEEVRAELQRTADGRRARTVDQLHDLLRLLGDLSRDELLERIQVDPDGDGGQLLDAWLDQLRSERRAVALRIAGEERFVSVEDTGDYVAVLGVQAPPGVPGVFLDPSERPLQRLVGRRGRSNTPFTAAELAERWGIPAAEVLVALEALHASGSLLRGGFLPGGRTEEWCDPDVLRRLRRRTLSHLRREIEPADRSALARFLMGWHGLQQPPAGSVAAARDVVVQLEGVEATPAQWERDLVAPRLSSWRGQWLDELVKTGQLTWMGRGIRHGSIQVALFATDHLDLLAPEPDELPDDDDCRAIRDHLDARGATFLGEIVRSTGIPHERALAALWRLAAAGHATNDSWSTLRAGAGTPAQLAKAARDADRAAAADADPRAVPGASRRSGVRTGGRRAHLRRTRRGPMAGIPGEVDVRFQGRWSLLPGERASEDERIAAMSDALLDTFGIVTRHSVQARPVSGGFAAVYRALAVQEEIGNVRRGWFVEGLGGAQFALPEAVDRLRAVREPTGGTPPVVVLRANDPAQPYGAVLAWPEHPTGAATPRRDASTYVVLRDGELLATVSPAGRRLVAWDRAAMPEIARALARVVDQRRVDRLAIEQLDDDVVDADTVRAFADTGFVRTPRGLRATPSTVAEVRDQLRASRRVRVGDVQLPTHGALPNDLLP